MGHIRKKIAIRGSRWIKVTALVDTGATFSLLPPAIARKAGLDPSRRSYRVRLADGKTLTLGGDLGTLRLDGRTVPAVILVGPADEPILGVEAMEALGVELDVRKRRLHATRGYTIRLGGFR